MVACVPTWRLSESLGSAGAARFDLEMAAPADPRKPKIWVSCWISYRLASWRRCGNSESERVEVRLQTTPRRNYRARAQRECPAGTVPDFSGQSPGQACENPCQWMAIPIRALDGIPAPSRIALKPFHPNMDFPMNPLAAASRLLRTPPGAATAGLSGRVAGSRPRPPTSYDGSRWSRFRGGAGS